MIDFLLNETRISTDSSPGVRVLDFIRDTRKLPSTRLACGEGDCGSCQVLSGSLRNGTLQYHSYNSCLLPLASVKGQHLVTIEGINQKMLNPVQRALVDQGAIQCGFCTPGLVMAITGFFLNAGTSSLAIAIESVAGNLCRCTGYAGIKRALVTLCEQFDLTASRQENRIRDLVGWGILPPYFLTVSGQLQKIANVADPVAENHLPDASYLTIAGGTDLMVQKGPLLKTQTLHFLPARDAIEIYAQECIIDAATRIETLRTSTVMQSLFPSIEEDFKLICSTPVRHQATLGGNLVNASPIADLAIFFLALDASVLLQSDAQTRTLALKEFYQGYKSLGLRPGEYLHSIRFRCLESPLHFSFEKVSKRMHLDIASVNSAMLLHIDEGHFGAIHISAGGVAPIPLYLKTTCTWLKGKKIDGDIIRQALKIAVTEINPIDDIRGSADYKRLLLRQLLWAHFLKLLPQQLDGEAWL